MLGNDVVDLGDPETRAEGRHSRFDARVFDQTERALIAASAGRERERWLLWAAKESAYKAARQEDPRTIFAPSCFVVRCDGPGRLGVTIGDRAFRIDVRADAEHVHAVARRAGDPPRALCTAVVPLTSADGDGGGSVAVRRLAIATLAARLGVPAGDLAIGREGRIPTLWFRGRRTAAHLSLSHHGRFVAFACTIPTFRSLV
jgi:phosphopantetheinyl transferase (holo-ACP synthase)